MVESRWSIEPRSVAREEPRWTAIRAAAELLLDPNPRVHEACERTLLQWGAASRRALEAVCECADLEARARVHRVLRTLNVSVWVDGFRAFASRDTKPGAASGVGELEEGLLRIAQLPRPLLDTTSVTALLDEWADTLCPEVQGLGPRKRAGVLARFFHVELGLRGDRSNYYDPQNSFLDQVIRNRRGAPITLSAIWLLVGRRIGLPLEGVGLPGHFIVRIRGARSILVDPFHSGRILTRRDCVDRLQSMGYPFSDKLLAPVSDRRMMIRVLGNLLHTRVSDDDLLAAAVRDARRALVG